MDNSIEDILNGNEPEPQPETVVEQVVEQAVEAEAPLETIERPRGPDGKFIPKEPTDVQPQETAQPGPSPEQTDRLPAAEYAALKDERRKRQEAEQRIAAMEAHYAQLAQQQARPPQEETDFWTDPDRHLASRFDQFGAQLLQRFEQQQTAQKIDASEAAAKQKYADYDHKFAAFQQAVQTNPRLAQELVSAADPGEFAYKTGMRALEVEQYGSIDALLQAERAKWEAEVKAVIQPRATLPSTTAADGSVGSRSGPEWSGPKPLGDIIGS